MIERAVGGAGVEVPLEGPMRIRSQYLLPRTLPKSETIDLVEVQSGIVLLPTLQEAPLGSRPNWQGAAQKCLVF